MQTPSMIPPSRAEQLFHLSPGLITDAEAATITDPYVPSSDTKRFTIRDIFRKGYPEYEKAHYVPPYVQKVMHAIMACGTGALGYTIMKCPDCDLIQVHPDSCGNRNCPSCGHMNRLKWKAMREAELIQDIPYFHVVFTVPHQLTDLIYQNQKSMLDLLFHASTNTVLQLCEEQYGMIPGIISVLHTCGSNMMLHYHIHMFVSGGGLSMDKSKFIHTPGSYFLPITRIAKRYRSLYLTGLKQLYERNALSFAGHSQKLRNRYEWKDLVTQCYSVDWNVEIRKYLAAPTVPSGSAVKSSHDNIAGSFAAYAGRQFLPEVHLEGQEQPVSEEAAPEAFHVLDYMSQYTNRTAMTDNRVVSSNNQTVVFEYKHYHDGGYTLKLLRLSVEEFIRRFIMNIVPKGFMKIRSAGFMAGCVRSKNLALIRSLLGQEPPDNPVQEMNASELVKYFFGVDPAACPNCSKRMENYGHRIPRKVTAQHLLYMIRAS